MAKYCKENIDEAKKMYYEYSKENKSELMDKIIEDTIPRFNTTISPDENKWSSLFDFLKELDVVDLSKNEYKSIW